MGAFDGSVTVYSHCARDLAASTTSLSSNVCEKTYSMQMKDCTDYIGRITGQSGGSYWKKSYRFAESLLPASQSCVADTDWDFFGSLQKIVGVPLPYFRK